MSFCLFPLIGYDCGIRHNNPLSAPMPAYLVYTLAALAEIAGCFAFWAWLKLDKSILWLIPGMASLALFAWLLTWIDSEAAGCA